MELLADLWAFMTDLVAEMSPAEVLGWSTLIATVIASLFSWAMTVLFRFADRLKPSWALVPMDVQDDGGTYTRWSPVQRGLSVSNVGVGPARLVSVIGIYCLLGWSEKNTQFSEVNSALVRPGDAVDVVAHPSVRDWGNAGILITWSQPRSILPGLSRKHQFIKLRDYFDRNEIQKTLVDTPAHRQTIRGPVASLDLSEVDEIEKRIRISKRFVEVRKNRLCRWRQFRKLAKAGWRWPQQLPLRPAQK